MSGCRWGEDPHRIQVGEGRPVIKDYIIGETIGRGSFGKVKKGEHVITGETVAIKIIDRGKMEDAKMDEKVSREIKILQLFSHPNICRLYDVIHTTTEIFLIMEYVECGELFQHIVNQGRLLDVEARYIFQQIICAVSYCHSFLVAHRDLKPENILLGPGLQVKLIDFGLSNIAKDGEFLRTSCGSPNYAAPEVIKGLLYVGADADVWSCGVILFTLVCGCLPFDENDTPTLFRKIKSGSYKIPAHVSSGARDLIEKILVVDPVHRLTIPQIHDHLWFATNLPPRLSFHEPKQGTQQRRILASVATRVARLLNKSNRDVRIDIGEGRGKSSLVYNIICDAEQRRKLSTEADEIINKRGATEESVEHATELTHVPKATERELHLGLLLTQGPVMESLLVSGVTSSNKHVYNGSNFVPASVRDTLHVGNTPPSIAPNPSGAFRIRRHTDPYADASGTLASSYREGVGSFNPHDEMPAGACWDSGCKSASVTHERQRVGSVAKSHMIYTREEHEFIVRNNVGWRIGLMTDCTSAVALHIIYQVLKRYDMEWKKFGPFRILVRPTSATFVKVRSPCKGKSARVPEESDVSPPKCLGKVAQVVILIHLFRIRERHDEGLLLDFSVLNGSMLALDIVHCLFSSLVQEMA